MAQFELRMPKLGESVTEGTVGKWLKRPGDQVAKYDLVVEVQTDKVNTEIPSPVSGTLKEVKVDEGSTVPIGTLLAVFETSDVAEASPARKEAAPEPRAAEPSPPRAEVRPAAPVAETAPPSASGTHAEADTRATPAVRKLAHESGVDISRIKGTGLGGRVTRHDVEAFVADRKGEAPTPAPDEARPPAPSAQPTAIAQRPSVPAPPQVAGDERISLTQMRKAIAQNMVYAWSAPHAHAVMEVDMTAVQRYREKVLPEFVRREGFELSPAAFVMKAAVEALRAVPLANASWSDEGIVLHRAINIGYAVSLGDDGLVVPVIREADGKSLAGLMRAIRDVVDRAKARKLGFEDFSGGTFTVNNTGPLGTLVSTPIVPPGQAAIVSSESIQKRLVVTEDDQIAIRHMMNLVIGFDHRVVDGSTAARVLQTMREWLQGVNDSVPVY